MSGPRRRKRAAYLGPSRRRPAVLDAASEVFAAYGYGGARMAAIALKADVRKPVLYDCFPGGKAEMFGAALERSLTSFEKHRRQTVGAAHGFELEDVLRWELTSFVEFARSDPAALAILLQRPGTAEGAITTDWMQTRAKIVGTVEAAIRPFMTTAAAEGSSLYAEAVVASALTLAGRPVATAAAIEPLVTFLTRGFNGLLCPPPFEVLELPEARRRQG